MKVARSSPTDRCTIAEGSPGSDRGRRNTLTISVHEAGRSAPLASTAVAERGQIRRFRTCVLVATALMTGPALTLESADTGAATTGLSATLHAARTAVGAPGVEAAVMVCGRLVWSGADGQAVVATGRPVAPNTRFVLASTTKTVTATMVLQLVEQGRLALDTPLAHFYPSLPNAGAITVRMLLDHTSGLPDYSDNAAISDLIDTSPTHRWTRAEIIDALAHMPAQFAPGSQYRYTNSNYVVLGGILEQVSARTVETDFRQMVASRVGLNQSSFLYDRTHPYAHPYQQSANGSLEDQWTPGLGLSTDYWGQVWTDGGLSSTAVDLARFGNGLFMGRLLGPATLAQMTDMGPHDYGLGIYDQQSDGHRWIGHDGDYGGYESEEWTDPQREITVALTTNVTEADSAPDTASDRILQPLIAAADRTLATPPRCVHPAAA